MSPKTAFWVAVAASVFSGSLCSRSQVRRTARVPEVAGCWSFGDSDTASDYALPATVALDTSAAKDIKEQEYVLYTLRLPPETSSFTKGSWRELGRGSIQASISDGFEGVTFELRIVTRDSLVGSARRVSDVHVSGYGTPLPVRGIRVPCDLYEIESMRKQPGKNS